MELEQLRAEFLRLRLCDTLDDCVSSCLSQMRGGVMACAWKHIWLLIFFVLFASSVSSRKAGAKRTKEK